MLRNILLFCFLIGQVFAQTKSYQSERTRNYDLIHTRIEVQPDWSQQYLYGTATLTIKPLFYPQSTVELNAKGFGIEHVILLTKTKKDTLKYEYDKRILNIHLGRVFSRLDTFRVEIKYIAKPNELPKGGSQAITDDKGLYFINPGGKDENKPRQLWSQGETEANSCWFPTFDSPNEKMTQEVFLTVENGFKTLSNGKLISSTTNTNGTHTDYWKQDLPHSPYLTMIAVGDFAIIKDKTEKGLELSYYVEPKFAPYAKQIFGRTPEMIRFFEQKLGVPFVWDKYAQIIVRDYVSGAMENTSATVFGDFVQKTDRQLLDGNDDGTIAHELFHHWFGDLVTCESWSNLPLNESFADYAEYLWAEHKLGKEEAEAIGKTALETYFSEAENKQEPLIRFQYADKEDMFDAHSYQKGGRVLHLLRNYVGDDAFWAALNLYLTKNKFQNTEIHDLRKAFEAVTGEDLNWFFNQWFLTAGHPSLKVSHSYDGKAVNFRVNQIQDSVNHPIYKMRLSLEIWTDGIPQKHLIEINQKEQIFTFPTQKTPDWVLFDADNVFLGVLYHEKTRPELERQAKEAHSYIHRLKALENIFATQSMQNINNDSQLKEIVFNATKDSFWEVRQFAINKLYNYDNPELADVERILQSAVRLEKKNSVRADAIYALASLKLQHNLPFFKAVLSDSSYMVAAAGLETYLTAQPADADSVIQLFQQENNVDILTAIANYYSVEYQESHYDWYIAKMNDIASSEKHRFLQAFGLFLLKSEPILQRQTIPLLDDIARNDTSIYARFGAFMALRLLAENEGVDEMLNIIRTQETNPQLKQVYKQME